MASADPFKTRTSQPGEPANDPATARFNQNASATVEDLQKDIANMRDDMTKLSQQVVDLLQAKGNAAYKRAKKNFDETAGDAVDAVRDVRDTFQGAVEESVQERPLATLALAVGVGFILGAMWRR
jgi:ElaB/YqjD/DUF883 family membrane-anchored ribosome-binding protein